MHGIGESLQAMEPEVGNDNGRVKEVARRAREQHLAAVSSSSNPGAFDDVETDVSVGDPIGLAGVQAHPHTDRPAVQGALRVQRRGDGVTGARERHEERVALRIDLRAAVLAERCAQQPSVLQ
jgi:hypothetical protein